MSNPKKTIQVFPGLKKTHEKIYLRRAQKCYGRGQGYIFIGGEHA